MTNINDLLIIQKILGGDVNEYATLVNIYKSMAVNLAYTILLNREDAEEVAQDSFIKAYTSLRSFKADAKFSTWLYRIILNTALNKKKIKKHLPIELTDSLSHQLPVGINEAASAHGNTERRKQIQLAMKSLNENERICITLFYLDELSVQEINKLTGITASNVKVLLYRGRKRLYELLQYYLKEEQ